MYQRFKLQNAPSHRKEDENGYLFVDKSPILKAGILQYYGSELADGGDGEIGGRRLDPDKIYKVYISEDELKKGADSFKMLPITNDHKWLGRDGADARDYQEGMSGDSVTVDHGMIYVPLKFTGDEIVADLKSGDKEELSASYTNELTWADGNPDYDFVASDIKGNHIALVEKGRCGSDVRVLNNTMELKHMKVKSSNELKLVVDGKELDLEKFFKQETEEEAHKADVVENEIETEKPETAETENEELEEEVVEEVKDDDKVETENVDKRALIDEVGGILKGKVDDEIIRTVIGKMEEMAYEGSEDTKSDNEDEVEEKEETTDEVEIPGAEIVPTEKEEVENEECAEDDKKDVVSKVENAIAQHNKALRKAYNTASAVIGEFSPFGMSERSMLVRALNHVGVDDVEKSSIPELYAMLKVYNKLTRVDNSYSYNGDGADEVEINI
jgi:hypothetical protein